MVMQLFRLATADLRRDWALSLCQVFALAAVLTPLLVLAGLRQGVLGQLMDGLRRAPAMREIVPRVTGTNRFTQSWIDATRGRSDVAFIEGDARFTAAAVQATPTKDPTHEPVTVTLVPSADDDPLRRARDPWTGTGRIVLSALAAHDLGVEAGSHLTLRIPRQRDGADEGQTIDVTVATVLPTEQMGGRRALLAAAPFVLAVQQFRDGYAIPSLGWPGKPLPQGPPYYERFRLYARSIDDVGALVTWLRQQGIEPVSRIADIEPVRALNHGLGVILLLVAGFAAAGMAVAIAATQWNAVQRKRRELALLALIGYGRCFLISMALLQGVLLGIAGVAAALALFAAAAVSIDRSFVHIQHLAGPACQLGPREIAVGTVATLALTLAASALAGWQIARIAPAEVLRET